MAERKINLDDRKYDALKRFFAEQGRDIDAEIAAQVEAMYEDLLPESERDRIEHDAVPIYPQGSFAIYSFKDQGEIIYFTSSDVMTLYESAKLYREFEANSERNLTLDSILCRYFGEDRIEIISENLFSVLTKAMANDERITAAIEYNLDSECVKVHGRDGVTVKHYTLDTLMDFLEAAELALVRNESERGKTLERFLEGKEYLTKLTTSKDYLIARLIVCEAASKVVNEDMDYMNGDYVDPLSDSLHNERKGLLSAIGQGARRDAEIVSPHLMKLIGEYTDKLWAKGFPEHYGWDKNSVTNAIVNAIQPQEVREFAEAVTLGNTDEDTVSPNNGIGTLLLEELEAQEEIGEIVATEDCLQITSYLAQAPESATSEERFLTVFSLMGCGLEDVHLVDRDEEHELATIVELNRNTLTEQGKRDWADVLGAKVERIFEGGYGVQICVSGCDPQRLSDFSFMLAGYVPESDFNKWVNSAPEQGENDAIQRL